MARIGNETKLLLKLAIERMERLKESRVLAPSNDYVVGYKRAWDDWSDMLYAVVREIES